MPTNEEVLCFLAETFLAVELGFYCICSGKVFHMLQYIDIDVFNTGFAYINELML